MGCAGSNNSAAAQAPTNRSNPVANIPQPQVATKQQTRKELPHTINDRFTMGAKLGEGGYSIVHEGISKVDGKTYAIKICDRESLSEEDEESLRSEVEILKSLNHKNVTRCLDFFEEPKKFYVVLELVQGGELFDRITKKTFYNEKEARDLVVIVLTGIKYLHDQNIAHRDLKPENLLLLSKDNDTDIKIADFGFAVRVQGESITDQCGTPGYIAPEILQMSKGRASYGKQCDMWSFGVIVYVLLGGYPPFHDDQQPKLFRKIMRGEYAFHPEYWSTVSEEAKDLIRGMLTVDPNQRLTVDQALEHPWCKAAAEKLAAQNLDSNLKELRKYHNTRKFKAAVRAVVAINRMSFFTKSMRDAAKTAAEEVEAEEVAAAGEN